MSSLFLFFDKMALTVDQMLERIGSLGFYQIRPIFILGYTEWFNITFQVLVPTFIATLAAQQLRYTVVVYRECSTRVLDVFLCRRVLFLLARSVEIIISGSTV